MIGWKLASHTICKRNEPKKRKKFCGKQKGNVGGYEMILVYIGENIGIFSWEHRNILKHGKYGSGRKRDEILRTLRSRLIRALPPSQTRVQIFFTGWCWLMPYCVSDIYGLNYTEGKLSIDKLPTGLVSFLGLFTTCWTKDKKCTRDFTSPWRLLQKVATDLSTFKYVCTLLQVLIFYCKK